MTVSPAKLRWAFWVGLATVVVWGANFALMKSVYSVATPAGYLFARYLVLTACAVALLLWRYGVRWPRPARADLIDLARLGLLGHTVHVSMVNFGVHWSTAFSSSLILACGPVFTLIILRWSGIEVLRPTQVAGVGVALIGVLVFLSEKLLAGSWAATGGDLFLLVACSLFSYYTVASKPLIERLGSVVVMTYATLAGAPLILLGTLPFAVGVDWQALSALHWGMLLWSTMVSAFFGWLTWGWVNGVRGVARTAPLMYLMPPVAAVIAWFAIDERFTLIKIVGALVTMGGVALAQFGASLTLSLRRSGRSGQQGQ